MLLEINPQHPEPRKVAQAVEALQRGEVIGYPTDTVYGLGCDLTNKKAVDRLYQIKQMNTQHPLAFICPDLSEIAKYAVVDNQTYRLLRRLLPGPYCFILEATREVPRMLHLKRKTVGIRVPDNAIIKAITEQLGRPVVSTTAARRDDGSPHVDPDEIDDDFKGLALVVDGGPGGMTATSVVDLTTSPPEVIREGAGPVDMFTDEAPASLRTVQREMRDLRREMG